MPRYAGDTAAASLLHAGASRAEGGGTEPADVQPNTTLMIAVNLTFCLMTASLAVGCTCR